jgi:hypothetical protein
VSDDTRTPTRINARALLVVGLIALVVSAPSIFNGFAYDDIWIIVKNARIHDLGRWRDWLQMSYWPTFEATLYRPLTTTLYALQWAASGGSPWLFHLVNILLYVAGAAAFTWLASLILPARAALIVGALFAVHPVHVEAMANGVGQSELSAGLVMLLAIGIYIRARQRGVVTRQTRLGLTALYLIGILLKEHAYVLPGWFAVAELTLFRTGGPLMVRARALAPLIVSLVAVAAFALILRWDVLGAFGGDIAHPALQKLSFGQRAFVMLGVVPDMARILIWPARLYADYSPQHVVISTTPHLSQLNGAMIAIGVIALLAIAWRRNTTAAFGLFIAFVVWLPTANLLFPSGVLLAERTMYLPSAGVLLAAGVLVAWCDANLRGNVRTLAAAGLGLLLVAGAVRSIERDRTWRSSEVVFHTMLRDAPLSFRAHYAWGGVLFERHDLAGGEREWRRAIRLMPGYHHLYQELAFWYQAADLCHAATPLFKQALMIGGPLPNSLWGLTRCQMMLRQYTDARRTAMIGQVAGRDRAWFTIQIATADSALAAADSVKR